jgi:hypothetical protein
MIDYNINKCQQSSWRTIIKPFEKPFEEYLRCNAEVSVGNKPVKSAKFKCFLWLPQNCAEEPHAYLYIENPDEYQYFARLVEKHLRIINIKIKIYDFGEAKKPSQIHVIKNFYFSKSNAVFIAENWFESHIKYHFPKYAFTKTFLSGIQKNITKFYISDSDLLRSNVSTMEHYSGEVTRKILSKITIQQEISHLGIESISTDKYIGKYTSSILEIKPQLPISSVVVFYRKIKPIVELILLITSFAERRRLNWYKSEAPIEGNQVEFYNTRVAFHEDNRGTLLISRFAFEDYLKKCLSNVNFDNITYVSNLLRSYLSGTEYSLNAKIILWNSILEKILKKNFFKKIDRLKEELIMQMNIYTSDLPPIQKLIDIRNDIAHGDEMEFNDIITLSDKWQILIERVLLRELNWGDLSKTAVNINGVKPYGL